MHRRAVAIAALVTIVVVTPSAAHAYSASDYTSSVSTTSPVTGASFSVTVRGPGDTPVILTVTSTLPDIPDSAIDVAGTKALSKVTDSAGVAVFTLTLSQGGTYSLVGTDATSGSVIFTQAVQASGSTSAVGSSGAAASTEAVTSTDSEGTGTAASSDTGGLAVTGSTVAPLVLGVLLLLGLGAAGIAIRRRRVHTRVDG